MVYAWIKFRTRHSSGPSDWDYREVEFDEPANEASEEFSDMLRALDWELTTQSEHWRGVEAVLEVPPKEWLIAHRDRLRQRIADLHAAQSRVEDLIVGA